MKDYTYFKANELVCKCGECDGGSMNDKFMQKIDQLRLNYGKPLTINSGFRCVEYNKKVSDSTKSAHSLGRAVDIHVDTSSKLRILELAVYLGFKRIGFGKSFMHLDDMTEDEGYVQTWWTY
jgi:uncharacterized protein YcbK (DUF882 family)